MSYTPLIEYFESRGFNEFSDFVSVAQRVQQEQTEPQQPSLSYEHEKQDNIHQIFMKKENVPSGLISFLVDEEINQIYISNVHIFKSFRNSEVADYLCEIFTDIYNRDFKGYSFTYDYINPRFENLIERKVKYGKIPKEAIEKRVI